MGKHSLNFGSAHPAPGKRSSPINVVKRADACTVESFYKYPSRNLTLSLNDDIRVQWDPACIGSPETVDIKIFLSSKVDAIHSWSGIHFANGEYTTKVPSNKIQSARGNYYFSIGVPKSAGTVQDPTFLATPDSSLALATGPAFTGTFDAAAAAASGGSTTPLTGNSSDDVTVVNNAPPKGLTKGQVAAAVIMPILVVAACIAGYVFWSRKKEATRRKVYRKNIDERMSIAPGADWAPISAAGAAAAIRHSMAISTNGGGDRNTRASSFFGRQSTYQADPPQEMRQTSRARNMSTEQSRTSRISFAETAHPRGNDRPAVPPLPHAYRKSAYSAGDHDTNGEALSPTQREGAFALDEDSIRDRLSGASANNNGEFSQDADTMPALAMMRANDGSPTPPAPVLTRESTAGDYRTYSIGAYSGNTDSIITDSNINAPSYFNPPSNSSDPDEALRNYATRNPQMLPVTTTASPFSGFAAGPGLAAAAGFDMSPDAIFRAYAATRPAQPPATLDATTPSTPGAMRNLYNPTMMQGLGLRPRADTMNSSIGDNNPYRSSMAPSGDYDVGKAH